MKKNSENKDLRVTVNGTRTILFVVILCVTSAISTAFMFLNIKLWNMLLPGPLIYFVMVTFGFISSGILAFIVWIIYQQVFIKPLDKVRLAAKQVAAGDFSVRIPQHRKDGKKDEFQILFDDFNMMAQELASTEIMKTDFIANVSHELKTPISVIQNFSAMLQSEGLTDSERKEYAIKIHEATKRLSILVTDILQLSRLENQKIVVNKKSYNLSEQLCRCILGFEQVWENKNIELNSDLDENIELNSDENLLDIVWNNLISNALKFTSENGIVEVTAKRVDGYAVISVKDNGCGMTEHDIKHVFDKFYQADSSHATKGNGLGLALVKEIITLVQGDITVDSSPDKGSIFTVKIKLD
ncbi:MAG: HAMP domain-containing histidine kinase [Clostridia bacterium]|nr:HAMP domain-containing histidine kinase [Clostridia bacterium]